MAKQKKKRVELKKQLARRNLFLISLTLFVAKVILILSVKNGGWLGADGESYLKGVDALLKDGIFSTESVLTYWSAGYPILIWIFSLISISKLLFMLSLIQSTMYFVASAFLAEKLRQTRLAPLAVPSALILALNPTLSLSSIVVGYESLVASCMILSVALIIHSQQHPDTKTLTRTLPTVALLQSFSAFFQPRFILIGFFILVIWAVNQESRKIGIVLLASGLCVMLILPVALTLRNSKANGIVAVSTNLGMAMRIGAGDKATGGYGNSSNLACPPIPPETTASDSRVIGCVVSWYLHNPVRAGKLLINKTIYFWSPWSGPLSNGTMARNPWLKIDPISNIAENKQGHDLVYGWFGKVISWLWLLGCLSLLLLGTRSLWLFGGLERQIAYLLGVPVLLAWLTSLGTIGDNRFRIPTMGLSLLLQVGGLVQLRKTWWRV